MPEHRIVQQIRLWIYLGMFLFAFFYGGYIDRHNPLLFIIGSLGLLLPFLELCPECRHLCWHEKGKPGMGPLWIGANCKNR